VRLEGSPPHEVSRHESLAAAELDYGRLLIERGLLRNIWRLPGRRANVSLYDVADASQLHDALSGLPYWPWLQVDVTALADHPLSPSFPLFERRS